MNKSKKPILHVRYRLYHIALKDCQCEMFETCKQVKIEVTSCVVIFSTRLTLWTVLPWTSVLLIKCLKIQNYKSLAERLFYSFRQISLNYYGFWKIKKSTSCYNRNKNWRSANRERASKYSGTLSCTVYSGLTAKIVDWIRDSDWLWFCFPYKMIGADE